MSDRITRYIRADLQKDGKGQLFVKGNLDTLDVADQIHSDLDYFENKSREQGNSYLSSILNK